VSKVRSDVTWKPLTPDEARKILSEEPPRMETAEDSMRYVEAWMVESGAAPERIKAVRDRLAHRIEAAVTEIGGAKDRARRDRSSIEAKQRSFVGPRSTHIPGDMRKAGAGPRR
jgi:hypothetical protein